MFNMISAEFYKLRKSRSFWIMLAVVAGMAVFMSVVFGIIEAEDVMGMRPESTSEMFISALPMHISTILFILVGFIIVFINSDFESGTVRNSLAVGISRFEYYMAKFVMILITCVAFVIAAVLATGLPYFIFEPWGDMFNLTNFMASVGVGYLILVAQATLFMVIALTTRKIGATLGIVLGYLVFDMIASAFMVMLDVNDVLRTVANVLPSPAAYYLTALSNGTANFGNVMLVVVVSSALIVVVSLLAVRNLVKKDI